MLNTGEECMYTQRYCQCLGLEQRERCPYQREGHRQSDGNVRQVCTRGRISGVTASPVVTRRSKARINKRLLEECWGRFDFRDLLLYSPIYQILQSLFKPKYTKNKPQVDICSLMGIQEIFGTQQESRGFFIFRLCEKGLVSLK